MHICYFVHIGYCVHTHAYALTVLKFAAKGSNLRAASLQVGDEVKIMMINEGFGLVPCTAKLLGPLGKGTQGLVRSYHVHAESTLKPP